MVIKGVIPIEPLASEMYSELKRKYKIAKSVILIQAVVLIFTVATFKKE